MADISKITLPSGVTYNLLDRYVWDDPTTNQTPQDFLDTFSGTSGTYDSLADLLNALIQAVDDTALIENIPTKISTATEGQYTDIIDTLTWLVQTVKAITGGDSVVFIGVSTNKLTDGGTEAPTGSKYSTFAAAPVGSLVFYGTEEFIKGTDNKWHALGSLDTLGALAYKDNASVSYKPTGTVGSTFTGTSLTSTGSYTPGGTVTVGITGSSNATAVVSQATSGTTTYKPTGTITTPTFTGTGFSITNNFTPAGSVGSTFSGSSSTFTGTAPLPSLSHNQSKKTYKITEDTELSPTTFTYQPAGSVDLSTAGTTTQVKQVSSITNMVNALAVAEPGDPAPANAITYYSVANETLSLYQIGATKAAPCSTANVTVKNGDGKYSFTGKGAYLKTSEQVLNDTYSLSNTTTTIKVTGVPNGSVTSSFYGTQGSITIAGTPSGTISTPVFEGTAVRLLTGNISVPSSLGATFAGTAKTVSVTGTPQGNVASTFTGASTTITVS